MAVNKENSGNSLPDRRRMRYGPSEIFQKPYPLWDDRAQYVYCKYGVIFREYLGCKWSAFGSMKTQTYATLRGLGVSAFHSIQT